MEQSKELHGSESGQALVEYAVMWALVAALVIFVLSSVGREVRDAIGGVNDALTEANGLVETGDSAGADTEPDGGNGLAQPGANGKVTMCHNGRNPHTIEVAPSAVDAHLAHGDYLGPCT